MSGQSPSVGLSNSALKMFFAVLLHNESVFEHFAGKLTPMHFEQEHYQLLYRVLEDHWQSEDSLPTEVGCFTAVQSYLEFDDEVISEAAQDNLDKFMTWAYKPNLFASMSFDDKKLQKTAFRIGKQILQQHFKRSVVTQIEGSGDDDFLGKHLSDAAEYADSLVLSTFDSKPRLTFAPGSDKQAPVIIQSTGLEFFDKYMSGGARASEVYGLMAPFGTCKTTLAVMLWVETAKQCSVDVIQHGGKRGLTVLVTYEAGLNPEIQHRSLMYAAQVHRESLENMGAEGFDSLSKDLESPLPYEQDLFKDAIASGVFKSELSRVEGVLPVLNEHTVCLDMSGSDPQHPYAGSGGISEIVTHIKAELRSRGEENHYVKNVIIDYLGLMVDRDESLGEKKRDDDHKLYQKQVEKVAHGISKKFSCHTWLLHQLSGSANSMLNPTKAMHHTDAKGSKSFGENLDFCFCIGNLNGDQLGMIGCTKHRRAKGKPPSIIQVKGEFNLVHSPNNFHIDGSGKIIDQATAQATGQADQEFGEDLYNDLINNSDTEEGQSEQQTLNQS